MRYTSDIISIPIYENRPLQSLTNDLKRPIEFTSILVQLITPYVIYIYTCNNNSAYLTQTITDLEFRLTNDLKSIDDSSETSAFQLHLIKCVVTSGLFPQV